MKEPTVEITNKRYQDLLSKEQELKSTRELITAINDAFDPDYDGEKDAQRSI